MFRSLVILFTLLLSANYSKAQFGELFYPLEQDALKTVQEKEPDKIIYVILTYQREDIPSNFDTTNFRSDLWIYMMSSKQAPYQYKVYGVIQSGINFIPEEMDFPPYPYEYFQELDLSTLSYTEHNVMDKLRENPTYGLYKAYQHPKANNYIMLIKTDQIEGIIENIPESFRNNESWVFNLQAFNEPAYLICLVNARSGEVFCDIGIVGVNDEIPVSAFDIYPNPVKEIMVITLDGIADNRADIRISDIYGKVAMSTVSEIRSNTISLPVYQLSPSVYFIRISCGGKDRWSKFIKIE